MKRLLSYITVLFVLLAGLQIGISSAASTMTGIRAGPNATASGGFLNSKEVTFIYSGNYICNALPSNAFGSAYQNQNINASKFTNCEVGIGQNTTGAFPLWISVPAYASLSIFGVNALGSSSQGYPIFQGNVIVTDCGGGISNTSCIDHPKFIYSPFFSAVENSIGVTNGIYGLPEGVLPTPAHTHIVNSNASGYNVEWYVISVLVLDPNIMPNATTGTCTQVVPSNLSDPTGNCLTSLKAIENAMVTQSTAVSFANAGNPIANTLGNPTLQVVIPGIPIVTEINNSDTNLEIPFSVKNYNFYTVGEVSNLSTTTPTTSVASTTQNTSKTGVGSGSTQSKSSTATYEIWAAIIAIIIIIIGLAAWMMMKKKK